MPTPAARLRTRLADDPARPFVTAYDGSTGERVELSTVTFDNWVAKTANLLQDGLGSEPGMRLALLLPLHWQALVWCVAAWSAGLVVLPAGGRADIVVTGPHHLERALATDPGEVVALSLRPFGARFSEPLPAGVVDYAEVLGYGDRFAPHHPVRADAPAVELAGRVATQAQLGDARLLDVPPGARVLTTRPLDTWAGLVAAVAGPLATGGSVVLARDLADEALTRTAETERVSVVNPSTEVATSPLP